MNDPRALTQVTRLFPTFLGLRLLPIGLWFLILPLPVFGSFLGTAHKALLVLGVLAIWPIHGWYRSAYGRVEPQRLQLGRSWMLLVGLTAAYLVFAFGGGAVAHRPLVVVLAVILFGTAALFALPRPFAGGRAVSVLFLGSAGLLGVLIVGLSGGPSFGRMSEMLCLSFGAVLCLAGVVEHYLFTRALSAGGNDRDV